MTDGFTLYGSPHSQYTYKVALMLRLSGAPFSFRYVSFQKGMHRTPAFRALSRWGQVPVLRHGERNLVQSAAILEYLAETLGKFAGVDPETRQYIREFLYWDADRFGPAVYGCYGVRLNALKLLPFPCDPAVAAHHRDGAEGALAALDTALATGDFLAAPRPTIADIACYGEVAFAELSQLDLSRWPYLVAWSRRIAALPGFAAPFDLLPMADTEIMP